ncbi:MAG: ABC transporter ATP-binding protein [Bryobacteraceae bacterium]
MFDHPTERLRGLLAFKGSPSARDFWVLRDISFNVERGETLSIIGPNGCGKSTLLQMVCGVLQPTSGRILTQGRIAALLELGAGFNPEFTGRDNVYLNGEIMGLSRVEITRALPRIEEFAEIGRFIDRPVKEYSSGMYVRLAFSTAIHVEPDILVVDEALAVGDAVFSNRCVRKFQELRRRQTTILFVSHDLGLVKQLSDRTILLMNGAIESRGVPKDVINHYIGLVLERQRREDSDPVRPGFGSHRHGDGSAEVASVQLLNRTNEPLLSLRSGEPCVVKIVARFVRQVQDLMIGILIRNRIGMDIYGTNTQIENVRLGTFEAGENLELSFSFQCYLAPQEYTLTVALQHPDGSSLDWIDDVLTFEVIDKSTRAGVVDLQAEVQWMRR